MENKIAIQKSCKFLKLVACEFDYFIHVWKKKIFFWRKRFNHDKKSFAKLRPMILRQYRYRYHGCKYYENYFRNELT